MKGRLAVFLTVALMLVVLVALNAASYVRVEQEAETEFTADRSTTNAGTTGTRALYEFLLQSGHTVMRWTDAPDQLLKQDAMRPSTLVVVGRVRRPFAKEEAEAVLSWVKSGGRLVLVDRKPDMNLLPASGLWRVSSEIYESPSPGMRPENAADITRGVPLIAPSQPTTLTRDVSEVTRSRYAGRLHVYKVGQSSSVYGAGPIGGIGPGRAPQPTPDDIGDNERTADDESWIEEESEQPPPPPEPITATREETANGTEGSPAPVQHLADGRNGEGALLVDYTYGRGRIIVLSDPFIISNGGINRADNLLLAANVVAGAGGVIAFDEYHQGYGSERNRAFAYFAGTPVLWMFAQAGIIVLAVLWTRGRRFARPLPAPRIDRRSNLEFVASMAELQQRARAYDLAVENVYGRTRRALARYGGTPSSAPTARIAERVAARSGKDVRSLEALMRECEDAVAGASLSARRALALVSQLREIERELGIRMRAREVRQAETR